MKLLTLFCVGTGLLSLPLNAAAANDSASLQLTVPAPDPVVAGEAVTFQVLAVNTGNETWSRGSHYWEAEIYDLDYRYIGRADAVTPQEDVSPGAVASAFIRFQVPETYLGRRFYRVFLTHNGRRLIESDYRTFLISERSVPPPPPQEKYKIGGNITVSAKDSDQDRWKNPSGATTANIVGKLADSSFLLNAYLLHESGKLVNPFIFLFNYYARWGTVSLGDISPVLSPLSQSAQGLRGAMFEQQRGKFHWILTGGQIVSSSPGTLTTNGRFQRLLFGGKGEFEVLEDLKIGANYALGADDSGSLSADPNSPKFRGPTLTPQKNPMAGLSLSWTPLSHLEFLGDFERSTFFSDSSSDRPGASDKAWRGEARWGTNLLKTRLWVQRAGSNFVSFGAPTVIPDRFTYDGSLNLFPAKWWTVLTSFDQYRDNLAGDPAKVTTTQKLMTAGNSFAVPIGAILNLGYSLNAVKGNPSTTEDNQTGTLSANVTQNFKGQSLSLGYQNSRFKDNTGLSHGLNSQTLSLNTTWNLFQRFSAALGTTQSDTNDQVDASQRKSQAYSASFGVSVLPRQLTLQVWGTLTSSKNNSPAFPSDTKNSTVNMEWTYATTPQSNLTAGAGLNRVTDSIQPANDVRALTATLRYSYSF